MSKLSLVEIWRDHHSTLIDARTGHTRPSDYFALYGPGLFISAGLVALELQDGGNVKFGGGSVEGMLAASGLIAAFFFGLSVTMLDKSIDFDLSGPNVSPAVLDRAQRMQEVAANTAFASVVAGVTTALLVVAVTVDGISDIAASLAVGGMATILTTGAMVLRRVYSETKDRLRNVRTGVSAER